MEILSRRNTKLIPELGAQGRWLLILLMPGYVFISGYRAYRARKLDLFRQITTA